jgi:hypothetical protein
VVCGQESLAAVVEVLVHVVVLTGLVAVHVLLVRVVVVLVVLVVGV